MRVRLAALIALLLAPAAAALDVQVLPATRSVPPHVAGRFRDAVGFQQSASGQYFVFDRRAHAVFGIDEAQTGAWEIVRIGPEAGRILDPVAFSVAADGTFVVADAPGGRERIQAFTPAGFPAGAFMLPGTTRPRISIDDFVLNGISTVHYTGRSVLVSRPESGALVTEYVLQTGASRTFGELRATGQEPDPELHFALNSGLPLSDPTGGYYFVFQAGVPLFRKYDAGGRLLFERHIEGIEIDPLVRTLPARWPRRQPAGGELPLVRPNIRAAAVDSAGRLWVSLAVPFTYVYDSAGDKIRTVQFRGAGTISPTSLVFGARGQLLVAPGLYEFEVR